MTNEKPIQNPKNNTIQNHFQIQSSVPTEPKDTAHKIIQGACKLVLIPDTPESVVPEAPYGRKRIVKYMWCDEDAFFAQLEKDINDAVAMIIIQSPYLYTNRLEKLEEVIQRARNRGILVCIFIQKPKEWDNRNNEFLPLWQKENLLNLERRIERLLEMSAHVTLKDKIHSKFIVIDEHIFWSGSVNSLSHRETKEDMTRWEADSQTILASLQFRDFDPCGKCHALRVMFGGDEYETRRYVGHLLHGRRQLCGLSQKMAAKKANVDTSRVSRLEKATLDIRLGTFIRNCAAIGLVLMPVPWFLVGAVENLIRTRYPKWIELVEKRPSSGATKKK